MRGFSKNFKTFVWPFLKGLVFSFCIVTVIYILAVYAYGSLKQAVGPNPQSLLNPLLPESGKIYARDGTLLYELYTEAKRTPVPLSEISIFLQNAAIAVEDKDFYGHPGISLPALARSALLDLVYKTPAFGGSTLTQQAVKNTVLNRQKTLARKLSEIVWAMEAEKRLTKDQILEIYLNSASFGRNAYGAEAAAENYFGKTAKDLSPAESAYLAAIVKAPSLLQPDNEHSRTLEDRKNLVLKLMLEQNLLTSEQYQKALRENVVFMENRHKILAPHFTFWLIEELVKKYGEQKVYEGGLNVRTTLDLSLQNQAEAMLKEQVVFNSKNYNAHNAALVALNTQNSEILAMVGSAGYFDKNFPENCKPGHSCLFEPFTNVAISPRQPGSSFKPYIYYTSFLPESAYFPGSIVLDKLTNYSGYAPQNYNHAQYGPVSLRKALAGSLNISAVRLLAQVGNPAVENTLKALGFEEDFSRCGLPLALGACEITLLEHTGAFASLARGGNIKKPTGILSITDKTGNSLENFSAPSQASVNPAAAYEIMDVLKDNAAKAYIFGSKTPLELPDKRPAAAKTGTTQNWKDGWTVGATPQLTLGVWTGNNDGTLMRAGSDGILTASPLWGKFMANFHKNLPVKDFDKPSDIEQIKIYPPTGKLAKKGQKYTLEIAASYAIPKDPPPKPKAVALNPTPKPSPTPKPDFEPVDIDQKLAQFFNIDNRPSKIIFPSPDDKILRRELSVAAQVYGDYSVTATLFLDNRLLDTVSGPNFEWHIPADLLTAGKHQIALVAQSQNGYYSRDSIGIEILE